MTMTINSNLGDEAVFILSTNKTDEADYVSIRAKVFEQMILRAVGRVERYLSDLYHDASYLEGAINPERANQPFFWGVRESGTVISMDNENGYVESASDAAWSVHVENLDGRWTVRFVEL